MVAMTGGLGRALGIRAGDGGPLLRVAALFALLEFGRGFGEIGVDTLVARQFGPTGLPAVLPFLYMGLGAAGLVLALAYTAALGRLARGPLFVGPVVIAAALIALRRRGSGPASGRPAGPVADGVPRSARSWRRSSWTVAGATFDARQAKRLFPLLTASAIAGYFAERSPPGRSPASPGRRTSSSSRRPRCCSPPRSSPASSRRPRARCGRQRRRRDARSSRTCAPASMSSSASPLLKRIAIAYVLLAMLMFSVQYPFLISAAQTFPTDAELATALGVLSAAVTAISFLVSVFVANRVYARFGVSAGAVMLPIVYLGRLRGLARAVLVPDRGRVPARPAGDPAGPLERLVERVLQRRPGGPPGAGPGVQRRHPGTARDDPVGLLLLAAGAILAPDQVFWLGAVTALDRDGRRPGVRRRYGQSLATALRSGAAERVLEGGPGVAVLLRDPSVGTALVGAVGAPEPGVREMAV